MYVHGRIRSDGDRHLTPYEVDRMLEVRKQPRYDAEPVEEAEFSDLDPTVLEAITRRARDLFPRVFGKLPDQTILVQLGVVAREGSVLRPTLSGLLVAGTFPQRYFPRLEVVFTIFSGTTKERDPETGIRYLDSKELIGPIPDMLLEVLALVQQRMSTGAVLEGGLRKDLPDYPLAAVREAVANALQHRDYSPEGRGTHVQVNLYADRLEITNPGGLYGATTVESLGKGGISSTRNEILSRLLTYTPFESGYVVENKGTGFVAIQQALADASCPPPVIQNSLTFFGLTLEKRRQPAKTLSSLRWKNVDEAILSELASRSSVSIQELMTASGLSRATVAKHVRNLVRSGQLESMEQLRSPKQRYRLKK